LPTIRHCAVIYGRGKTNQNQTVRN
jgi:hypothetical protein